MLWVAVKVSGWLPCTTSDGDTEMETVAWSLSLTLTPTLLEVTTGVTGHWMVEVMRMVSVSPWARAGSVYVVPVAPVIGLPFLNHW